MLDVMQLPEQLTSHLQAGTHTVLFKIECKKINLCDTVGTLSAQS